MSVLIERVIRKSRIRSAIIVGRILTVLSLILVAICVGVILGRATNVTGKALFFKEQTINLFVGISGGILTTFLLCYSNRKSEHIYNILINNVSNDIKITGIWVEKYVPVVHKEELQKQELVLDIRQQGFTIDGIIKADDTKDCPEIERKGLRTFDVSGKIKNELIGLDCLLRSDNRKGRIQYLLRLAGDGSKMVGWTTYFDVQNEVLTAAECEFYRIDDVNDVRVARKELNENRDASLGTISEGKAD